MNKFNLTNFTNTIVNSVEVGTISLSTIMGDANSDCVLENILPDSTNIETKVLENIRFESVCDAKCRYYQSD
ncbi:MAG: hypothetical protein RR869_08670 [Lachnospiraceae bacterium]